MNRIQRPITLTGARLSWRTVVCLTIWLVSSYTAQGHATVIQFTDASGLGAEAEFTYVNSTTLQVRLKNTSTGVPSDFSNSDQLLTSISWDFGGATSITGGSMMTGPTSASVNFSITNVGASADVSGEFGYGNGGATGLLPNFVSGNTAGVTPFGGANLDGPVNLNGPQAGLVANPNVVSLGGLGAIQAEWLATVMLSEPIADLSFLANGVAVEFGSDAAFLTPEPESAHLLIALAVIAGFAARSRHRPCS